MSLNDEQLEQDRLEASSIRYGVWVRIASLTSGRWAVFHGEEAGGGLETGVIEIFDSLDPVYLRRLSANEQAKREERQARILEVAEDRARISQSAKMNLEDMGL